MKKYELTDETKKFWDITLYRIEALRDFGNVKAGDKGGWIESKENLSQEDTCWVGDSAMVYGDARVRGCAQVFDTAQVSGTAYVAGTAQVYEDARIGGHAQVYEDARIGGDAQVYGYAQVYEDAQICGYAQVGGTAQICGYAQVGGTARVYGIADVCGDAIVGSDEDYIIFKNWWSSGRYFTWTRSNNKWRVGCFYGTGDQLIRKAYKDSKRSGREYERIVRYVEEILQADSKQIQNNR